MKKLPDGFVKKMNDLLKDEAEDFFATYKETRLGGLRINPLKIQSEQWEKQSPFPLKNIPFVENGYYYSLEKYEPGKHPYHFAGVYYIQEPSAMFVAPLLDVKPGEKVLDLCAAPGGKTTQIGASLKQQGILVANEIHPKRAKVLSENVERFGLQNAIVTNETPERLAQHFPSYFDKIIVDAPCSGEGMFRKDPEAIEYWSEQHVLACQKNQMNILDAAVQMLREDGILVYSTCTFSPEENEQVIERFLDQYPNMELIDIEKGKGIENGRPEWSRTKREELKKTARLWPHKLDGEGHFVAKMKKSAPAPSSDVKTFKIPKNKKPFHLYFEFEREMFGDRMFSNIVNFGNVLHHLPDYCPDLTGLKVLRAGVHLGELKKNRFEPNHALGLTLKKEQVNHVLELASDETNWIRYIKGETLPAKDLKNGWTLITVDGFPLGWGKVVQSIIKNYYPKGLRWMKENIPVVEK
ncbi:RsmF rRNA methyltransferase first C-terminal domain-containing protein [Fervidibacillus halotolerans]|uniref:RsmF rRNA methyltransferase first C-terminal domain-containing protein n=1 Tax=Fervidibacillus halotolerans TaxID=2980027 RepID=A0A9E8M0L1_9BACI|nr:RsmB/NOP family class I SAM-dependent RNA methyltransferase [Fervidibacillus halotolerans]WAA13283.1 RsmF rRNA methyltransferase first C-terminal domain-containing protein [Fervidibacillus halotolerans]